MQLFRTDTTIFSSKLEKNAHKKLKKQLSKVAQKYAIFFSPIAVKTALTEDCMFQNVAYGPTVYRAGIGTI